MKDDWLMIISPIPSYKIVNDAVIGRNPDKKLGEDIIMGERCKGLLAINDFSLTIYLFHSIIPEQIRET